MELRLLLAFTIVISVLKVCECGYGYGGHGYGGHMKKYYGGHGGGYGGHGDYGGHGGGYGGHGDGYGGHGGGYGGHGGGYGGHGGGYEGHGGGYGGHGGGYGGHGGGYGGHGGGYGGHGGGYGGHGGGGHAHYHFYPVYKKKGFGAGGSLLAGLASGLAFGLLQMPVMMAAAGRKRRDVVGMEEAEGSFHVPVKYGMSLRKKLAEIEGEQPCQVALHLCDLELAKLMSNGGRAYATHAEEGDGNGTSIRDVYEKYLSSSSMSSGAKGDRPEGLRSELGFIMCSQLLPKCSPYYYSPSQPVTLTSASTSGSSFYVPFEEDDDDEVLGEPFRNFSFNRTITSM